MTPKVSLFASAIRSVIWPDFFKSLEGTSVPCEVVFSGPVEDNEALVDGWWPHHFLQTANIKPAQCYEIARKNCLGEVVIWVADDCEFPNDVIGKAYNYWKKKGNEKLILSLQTAESGYGTPTPKLFPMGLHRFFGGVLDSPLMAPLGLMSRKFLEDLGGLDRRYVCGQYENDIVMRAYIEGGDVEVFGDKDTCVVIDHLGKSLRIGESKQESDFINRPFAKGYITDRTVLEQSWTKRDQIVWDQNKFEPYEDGNILVKSQSNKGIWD